jgi:lactosylceramide 4-alpha-galactosyltransferase
MEYKNVHLNYLNISQYTEHTPLKQFMQSGELFRSQFVNSHTSDILRYLTLWRYGGTYLDLDIVMLKNLNELSPNYAGAESKNYVAVGIINLEHETGHEIAELCLRDLLANFNGNDWGNNGPGVLTRVLQKICNTKNVLEMIADESKCGNFKVLPIEAAYSIRWPEHIKFFREEFLNETLDRLSNSVIAHVWNKHSAATQQSINSNSAYLHLARKHCPKVLSASEYF